MAEPDEPEVDRYAQMAIDHGVDDDDPVLGAPDRCGECGKLGHEVPLTQHESGKFCDSCLANLEDYGRRHFAECDSQEEIFFDFHVRVGVKVKNREPLELKLAKLRAMEVLLGMPMTNDQETWEHELISVRAEDSDDEIEIPETN